MKYKFKNKVVLITGSSGGIGRAIARSFFEQGASVVINYLHSRDKAEELRHELKGSISIKADVSKDSEVKEMIEQVIQRFGEVDILINNAGIAKDVSFLERDKIDWDNTMNTNLYGVYNCSRQVAKKMLNQGHGNIINIASTSAIYSFSPNIIDYDASKAGVLTLTKNFAKALSPDIRVNAIAPGWVNTEINASLSEEFLEKEKDSIYLGRFANPSEIASICLFLASEESSFITGTTIVADGGHD